MGRTKHCSMYFQAVSSSCFAFLSSFEQLFRSIIFESLSRMLKQFWAVFRFLISFLQFEQFFCAAVPRRHWRWSEAGGIPLRTLSCAASHADQTGRRVPGAKPDAEHVTWFGILPFMWGSSWQVTLCASAGRIRGVLAPAACVCELQARTHTCRLRSTRVSCRARPHGGLTSLVAAWLLVAPYSLCGLCT